MPAPRYIPAQENSNWLGETLKSFIGDRTEKLKESQESDALQDIYKQYEQDGKNLEKTIFDIQSRPGISPTTRVNTVKQLMEFKEHNREIQKKIVDAQAKEQEKTATRNALKEAGATAEDIALYESSPVGGQTEIVKSIVERNQRKQMPPGLQNEDVEDYDIGLTAKERVKRQDARFTLQTPIVNKNSETLSALENEGLSIKLLGELNESDKVGQGLNKLNINPKTGDLFIPQLATPEEQLFVKTVNDFTVKAKDSFGARVTNFELDRFMQRLPTLANSKEGRRLIMRQMNIINELNTLEKRAVQEVFDQYGVRNIDYVDAENKARVKIKDQKDALRKEYLDIEQLSKKTEKDLVEKYKAKVMPGYVLMKKPDGTIKQFPEKNITNLEEKGYERI